MEFVHLTAGDDDDGRRLDRILRRFLSGQALSGLYRAIRTGLILVDGKKTKPDFRISKQSDITVARFLLETAGEDKKNAAPVVRQENIPPVLYLCDDLIVINKPYDIPVQPSAGTKPGTSLAEIVPAVWKSNKQSLSFRSGPLHRLDRKTTGILFFSRTLAGAQWFSHALASHQIIKKYIALAQGKLPAVESWQDELLKNTLPENKAESSFHTVSVQNDNSESRCAFTKAAPLAYGVYKGLPVTLVEYVIGTGRTHQIRAQSSFHGYPLLGDTAYGGIRIAENQDFYLHAVEVCLPDTNPCNIPSPLHAFISTNFEKMLTIALIKWDGTLIL